MKTISVLGIDLAKNVFELFGVDELGRKVVSKRVSRQNFFSSTVASKPELVVMEACAGAHFWGKEFRKRGLEVKLISPQFVRPFVKTNKNDRSDAEAIVEAASRPSMRFVAIKENWQQDIQSLHRVRQGAVAERTRLINEMRGLLQEYGMVISRNRSNFEKQIVSVLENESLSASMRELLCELHTYFLEQQRRVKKYDDKILEIHRGNSSCQRLSEIVGVGAVTATAIVAATGDARRFKNGRQFSAWLGLVPRHVASGNKRTILGISKRGDRYIRELLIHGARSAIITAPKRQNGIARWSVLKKEVLGMNKATVALANKHARIIWALLAKNESYRPAV